MTPEFKCPRNDPKCREQLVEVGGSGTLKRLALIGLPILAVLGALIWWMWGTPESPSKPSEQNVEQMLTDVWPWLKTQ